MPRFDLNSIISSLDDEGFRYFKSDRVFCKRIVRNGVPLYLTMGINKHRFYDSLYTMDLYVNVHTQFLEVGGVPFNYNRLRPGRLLSEHERENLCATEKSTTDVWWDLSDARELDDFVASVKLASRRILDDSSFIDRFINDAHNNEAINEIINEANQVTQMVIDNVPVNHDSPYLPSKLHDGMSMQWYICSDTYVKENKPHFYYKSYVRRLAIDAFRRHILSLQITK